MVISLSEFYDFRESCRFWGWLMLKLLIFVCDVLVCERVYIYENTQIFYCWNLVFLISLKESWRRFCGSYDYDNCFFLNQIVRILFIFYIFFSTNKIKDLRAESLYTKLITEFWEPSKRCHGLDNYRIVHFHMWHWKDQNI